MKVKLHRSAQKYYDRLPRPDRDRFDDAFEDLEKEPPEGNIAILKPLLSEMAGPLYTIESATPEETKKAEKRIKEYEKDPSIFVSWKRKK